MIDKNVLAEISEILSSEKLSELRKVHIEIHNGHQYGNVIITSSNTALLIELKNDLGSIADHTLISCIHIPTKSGKGALLIASKISEILLFNGIEVTQSGKAFR